MNHEGKKTISVMIPCYNEEENARPIYEAVRDEILKSCPAYDYEILFIDNKSTDGTRPILEQICAEDKHVKAIFNCKNFGQFNSPYYGILNTSGDCTITICADFQDPVEMIPKFVAEWEKGYKIVIGKKTRSKESKIMYFLRGCYYKVIRMMSDVEIIEQFTGFGLYDKSFVDTLRSLKDPTPFIRGIVAELGPERKEIEYEQPKRRAGKTHNNFMSLYDAAMLSFTSYTKLGMRIATFCGLCFCGLEFSGRADYAHHETVHVGAVLGGIRPNHHGGLLYQWCTVGLPGLFGGVCDEHEHPCHESTVGCRRKAY